MKVANLVKAYVEKYKHMRKHKKTDGEDTREVENWEQATASMTCPSCGHYGNNRHAVASHCKQSAEKQDENRLSTEPSLELFPYGNEFRIFLDYLQL